VVHIHASEATHWDFASGWYGSQVEQSVVNEMVNHGLMQLTGMTSVAAAWGALLPDYAPGQKIAVKVNFNNASCGDSDNQIDALIEPVNALIGSLVAAGIQEDDVWIYDASRRMPSRFYSRRQYTSALYIATDCADQTPTFGHVDPSLRVPFADAGLNDRWLPDLLYEATYLVNMPILKGHGIHPVTLGFKNHFGTIDNITGWGSEPDNLHYHIYPGHEFYNPDSLVDIYANPNIGGKTVLTVGDGLFGAPGASAEPVRWGTFGDNAPNSLFFSADPVASDCVMADVIRREWTWLSDATYDYLRVAADRGLGTFESGDPGGSGYSEIDYLYIEI
jgi:hypothetical protein